MNTRTLSLLGIATLVAVVVGSPTVYLIWRTLGVDGQFLDLLLRVRVLEVLLRTVLLAVVVSIGSTILGLVLGWVMTRVAMPFKRVIGVALVMPLAVPSFVMALTFTQIYGPRGFLQQLLNSMFGVESIPSVYGFPAAAILLILLTYPFVYLATIGALARFDQSLVEISKTTGRGAFRTLKDVVAPVLWPALAGGATLSALYTLSDFGAVSLVRYDTFTTVIYQQYTNSINLNLAAASSLVLVVVSVLVLAVYIRRSTNTSYRSGLGASRNVRAIDVGLWRWPLVIALVLFVVVAFASHVGVIVWWLVRPMSFELDIAGTLTAVLRSAYVAGLAAIVTVVMALPVAAYIARHPGIYAKLIRIVSTMGFGLPGIVLAIALVFWGVNVLTPIYQTIWSLVLAYVVMFISIPIATILASFLQVNPHLEEQAAVLGYSWRRRFITVILPLILPGVLLGISSVFLLSLKELPATIVLSPAGFGTLATAIWNSASEGFFARTALSCLVLVLAGIPLTYTVLRTTRNA